jgi:RimJ/RimL family protein N-acetyltransferase
MRAIIETKRLILRPFNEADADAVFEFGSNKEIIRYTGGQELKSVDHALEIIQKIFYKDYALCGYGRWAVIYKPDNKLIGFAGLKYIEDLDETDIGFRFLPQYWGRGIGTEASIESITYGFQNLNLTRIIGIAMPENIGSCRVLEKSGLTFYKQQKYGDFNEVFNWYEIVK